MQRQWHAPKLSTGTSAVGDHWTEPGRWVNELGQIVYAWPPEGRFADLWRRIEAAVTEDERGEAVALLNLWRDENSTLVAYTDDDGEWVDCEPDWSVPEQWKDEP